MQQATSEEDLLRLHPLHLIQEIGHGSFGRVVIVRAADGNEYAVKIESKTDPKDPSKPNPAPQLREEMRILLVLQPLQCVPRVYFFWEENDSRKMMFERLGPNLEQLKEKIVGDNLLWTATRLLHGLAEIHKKKYLHRDIKPENILVGRFDNIDRIGPETNFYYVDFGMGKRYCERNGQHVPMIVDKKLRGTARFASINTHRGYEQSRRDDLESLGYVFIYLHLKKLPWMGITSHQKIASTIMAVGAVKSNISLQELCHDCPPQFLVYMTYIRQLMFDQEPDYDYLEMCLRPKK